MSITKEVIRVPRKDGTGPMGRASMNGAGLGLGQGSGYRRGPGKFVTDPKGSQKELLQEQKELLERKLDVISKQLESI